MMLLHRIALVVVLLLSLLPAQEGVASGSVVAVDKDYNTDDDWSNCNCPAVSDPNKNFDDATTGNRRPPSARIAYLISVHNQRTIQDGAYLLKSLIETSYPGDIAIILIHVDKRVGIASRDNEEDSTKKKKSTETTTNDENQYLYHDSWLRQYVDACIATPVCARDGKTSSSSSRRETNATASTTTIIEVHSHSAPEWSKWSMNDPTLWAMEYLTHHRLLNNNSNRRVAQQRDSSQSSYSSSSSWDVFINLSGDTRPVITAHRISQLFHPTNGPLGNTNFVTGNECVTGLLPTSIYDFPQHTMKRSHYFQKHIPKTITYLDLNTGVWQSDIQLPIYFGSQWMSLTNEFVTYVIRSMGHPNGIGNVIKDIFIDTDVSMTDETFFATILMNSPYFNNTLPIVNKETGGRLVQYPRLRSIRYERMDENIPNAWGKYISSNPLYDITKKFSSVTNGEGPAKAWGPYFLGIYDLGDIKESGALFVRKVSWTVDDNLVRLLPVVVKRNDSSDDFQDDDDDGKLLEWDVLPDIRWPELGVKIREPFHDGKKMTKNKKDAKNESEDEADEAEELEEE